MRNRLFLAFLAVVVTALVSNLIYKTLTVRDFEDYVRGTREDKLYWVLAAVEGSYTAGAWDRHALHEAVHWALMLGFEVKVADRDGAELVAAREVIGTLAPEMKRRMAGLIDIASGSAAFEDYPLYMEGNEIGTMFVRQLRRPGEMDLKERRFMERGDTFLTVSFLIAGGGAVILSLILTLFFSRPLRRMKDSVEAMAGGDLSVRMPVTSKDEIGMLGESFNYMAEALQREEAIRRHLTANVAHELRTPLAVMKANVEAMIDGVLADRAKGLENIRIETEKLIRLVEGIEDLTTAEASFFERRECVLIDLTEFVQQVAAKMGPVAAAKGLYVRLASSTPLTVCTEPDKLERILQNIVANAISYTERGGILIDFGARDNRFFIMVEDTGPGIPVEKRGQVFDRFRKGSDSKGLGLGLAIVQELVNVMAGRVEIGEGSGGGARFTVELPSQDKPT